MDTEVGPGPEGLAPEDLPFAEPDWGEYLVEAAPEFADNPGPRCPCVLVLDNSSSMAGPPLAAVNEGVSAFRAALLADPLARQRVEVAVVACGTPVEVVQPFVTADRLAPPALRPRGQTPLGTALLQVLDLLDARTAEYRGHGVSHSRPWLFLLTDGMPQGEPWEVTRAAVQRVKAAEAARRLVLFAVGVSGANLRFLSLLSVRPPLHLDGLRFAELFTWLSASAVRLASSPAGEPAALPQPGTSWLP